MNSQTKRRTVLGGLALTAVGGTGALLNRTRSGTRERVRWLRPLESVAESTTFAYVAGVPDDGDLEIQVAMRERIETGQTIELFGDDDPVTEYFPPLRSFWRFDVDVSGRTPGESEIRVGDATLPVELVTASPPSTDAQVRLTPRVMWRADHLAHVRGYSTGDGGGRLHVAFRERTADPPAIDELGFRDPGGAVVGRHTVPAGVRETALAVDPLTVSEADGELVGYRDGVEVDVVPLFYR